MPLIDFKCKKCGEEFFEIVTNNEDEVECPKCKDKDVLRLYKGKYYGKNGRGSCSGSCAGCSGCH